MKHAQFLHPEKRNLPDAINAICNLALTSCGSASLLLLSGIQCQCTFREPTYDMIRDQRQSYQMQEIPKEFGIVNNDISPRTTYIQKDFHNFLQS